MSSDGKQSPDWPWTGNRAVAGRLVAVAGLAGQYQGEAGQGGR
jgi:hypothetical protein